MFEGEEMVDQSVKIFPIVDNLFFFFLIDKKQTIYRSIVDNLILWIQVNIYENSLSLINFVDWLGPS